MGCKWVRDFNIFFMESIRLEKILISIFDLIYFIRSFELLKKYLKQQKSIMFGSLDKFSWLRVVINLMREFIRKYIRKKILNFLKKEIEFYKGGSSNNIFDYIILKKMEFFKNVLAKNKVQKQIFRKIFELKDLQISKIHNKNSIFINNFRQIIIEQKNLFKIKKKKVKIIGRNNAETLKIWLKCLKFYLNK